MPDYSFHHPVITLRLSLANGRLIGATFCNECREPKVPEPWYSALLHYVKTGILPPVPIELVGTAFQQEVWQALRTIPSGTTESYGALAKRLGRPSSARAIGRACGANPCVLFVPCHRVVGAHGIGGFSADLAIKQHLLSFEQAVQTPASTKA